MRDFENLVQRLIDGGVEFVVIGGFAAVAHGATRVTRDLDLCAPFSPENLDRLASALAPLSPAIRVPGRAPMPLPESLVGYRNLYLHTTLGELDILSAVTGLGEYPAVRARSIELHLWDRTMRLLSLEGLLESKRALGRERDREALPELELILKRRSGV